MAQNRRLKNSLAERARDEEARSGMRLTRERFDDLCAEADQAARDEGWRVYNIRE